MTAEIFIFWMTGTDAFTREGIQRLEGIGATDVVIGFRDPFACQAESSVEEKPGFWNGMRESLFANHCEL